MSLAKGRVLILDDEPAIGKSISAMVRHFDMESLAVVDPQEFFDLVATWFPTHIILDLIMPAMDGVEVLLKLAELGCEARIALSSGLQPRVVMAAQRSGQEHGLEITQILPKPVTFASLEQFLTVTAGSHSSGVARRAKNADSRVITLQDLETAIELKQFHLLYQPISKCGTRMLKGFEALARWVHPEWGNVPPDQFIPLAEEWGLIHSFTDFVTGEALSWFSNTTAFSDLTLSINISAKTFSHSSFPDDLHRVAHAMSVSPENVTLEVTETAAVEDQLLALDLFTRLRVKGFNISIDDFGIGNSSLSMLSRLPFSEVKVDKSFAINAGDSDEARTIIRSTVDLAHDLNLTVVAEGVEDVGTFDYLESIGCDYAQGYYIARPMKGDQAIQYMLDSGQIGS